MTMDQFDYRIGTHFLPALINADTTGLKDFEEAALANFLADAQQAAQDGGFEVGHWTTADDAEAFGRCEVTDLFGMVANVSLMVYRKEPA